MKHPVNTRSTITWQHATAAADTAVAITLSAATSIVHVLAMLAWSYSDTPVGGKITVACGGVTIFEQDLVGVEGSVNFYADENNPGLNRGIENEAMVVTLAAGGGTAVGKLNIGTL